MKQRSEDNFKIEGSHEPAQSLFTDADPGINISCGRNYRTSSPVAREPKPEPRFTTTPRSRATPAALAIPEFLRKRRTETFPPRCKGEVSFFSRCEAAFLKTQTKPDPSGPTDQHVAGLAGKCVPGELAYLAASNGMVIRVGSVPLMRITLPPDQDWSGIAPGSLVGLGGRRSASGSHPPHHPLSSRVLILPTPEGGGF